MLYAKITGANRLTRMLFLLMTLLIAIAPANAQTLTAENAIKSALIAEQTEVAPGETLTVAIRMRPDAGWHGYWINPGDAGVPDQWVWDVPEGVEIGPLRYPVPGTLIISGIMNYVYVGEYALLAEVKVPEDAEAGAVLPISVVGDWLACTDEICVPEHGELSLDLRIGAGGRNSMAFDDYRAALPRPLGSEAHFALTGNRLRLAVPLPASAAVEEPYFFPITDQAIDYSAPQRVTRNGDFLIVEIPAESGADRAGRIEGLLKIGANQGLMLTATPGEVPAAGSDAGGAGIATVLLALGGAILGGLLLNIMPCVFPILSLKALSLARAGGDERAARRDALAYSAGVILVCLVLGGILLALRASGETAGWAFQLQDPRMILVLLLLVTAIALNLAGLFELPSLGGVAVQGGTTGSFLTGALAAFVATPCTGPFMAAALGAALILPGAIALAIFAGLGLGLALPFLLIAFVPALRRRLPQPGPWMARFRHIMAVPMLLTALALAWVLGRQTGVDGLTLGLAAALLLALCLWWSGNRQRAGKTLWPPLLPALGVALAGLLLVPQASSQTPEQAAKGALDAQAFSEERLASLREEGRPVFVYFTADWCITCKANEVGALANDAVARHFADTDTAVLVGDWTTGDRAIGRFLEAHGRSGIPLYLYYAPGKEPEVLPQILTSGRLTALS